MKKYRFETLSMLGQMYDESGEEEVNFDSSSTGGTLFYLASDVDQFFEKDSLRTKEHNLLVQENRQLREAMTELLEQFDAYRNGWMGSWQDRVGLARDIERAKEAIEAHAPSGSEQQ
jgi:hypothetical protein